MSLGHKNAFSLLSTTRDSRENGESYLRRAIQRVTQMSLHALSRTLLKMEMNEYTVSLPGTTNPSSLKRIKLCILSVSVFDIAVNPYQTLTRGHLFAVTFFIVVGWAPAGT